MAPSYSIGQLARQTGCNLETIRYYERTGIMPQPQRTPGGHRVYEGQHLDRLAFVIRARELGFPLNKVRELLELVDRGSYTCEEVYEVTVAHLAEVRHKLTDLKKLERTLARLSSACRGGTKPDCAVIQELYVLRSEK